MKYHALTLCLILAAGVLPVAAGAQPVVFWAADPVAAGDTVLLTGAGLAGPTAVTVQRLADGPAGSPPAAPPRLEGAPQSCTLAQPTNESLKFILPPKLAPGLLRYEVRATGGTVSGLLNRPVLWWAQGDQGTEASPGGYLRLFGKNLLGPGKTATVFLEGTRPLRLQGTGDVWSLQVPLPASAAEGNYRVYVHNGYGGAGGWSESLPVTLRRPEVWPSRVFNVADYGATGQATGDETAAVQAALDAAGQAGGGVVYFPRGMYQLSSPLTIPRFTVLRGEAEQQVALLWPDTDTPPKLWISGTNHFGLENLTLYCSNYTTFLGGDQTGADAGNVFLRHVRVRADIYRGHEAAAVQDLRYRQGLGGFGAGHWLIQLGGSNVQIEDCDLYSSGCVIGLKEPRGCVIRDNQLGSGRWGGSGVFGGDGLIIEGNRYYGASLTSWGGAGGVGYGNLSHLYIAHNSFSDAHGGDSEQITSDAGGGLYYGSPAAVGDRSVALPARLESATSRWVGGGVYVVSGPGMGQWRKITGVEGARLLLDRPWQVAPNQDSKLEVTFLLSHWLILDNSFHDVGISVQFYGLSMNHIVAGNTCARAGGYQAIGKDYGGYNIPVAVRPTHQPTWYCQFLDNTITEGNIYRSGANNSILAGSSVIGIYGWPGARDWPWPMAYGQVVRGNHLENNALIHVGGGSTSKFPAVRDVVVEHNTLSNSPVEVDAATTGILVRDNSFSQVQQPLAGAGMAQAWVPPADRLTAWLQSVRMALSGPGEAPALDQQLASWQAEASTLPADPAAVQARRRELAGKLWKILAGQPGPVSADVLQALAGLQLQPQPDASSQWQPQPDASSLWQVLTSGQGGTGAVKVNAALSTDGVPLSLVLSPVLPAGWPTAPPALPVALTPGAQKTLVATVSAPAGAWGRWTIPVDVIATWQGRRLVTRLSLTLGHGTVTNWYVLGPFSHPAGQALDETPHAPEFRLDLKGEYTTPQGKLTWKPVVIAPLSPVHTPGALDFNAVLGQGDNLTAYAVAVIHAARPTSALVTLQAQQGAMCWLQGQEIPGLRLEKAGTASAGVTLPAGDSIFLVKVSKLQGTWRVAPGQWTVQLSVDQTGAGPGGDLTQLAPPEMLQLSALTPPPSPPAAAGQRLSWSEGVAWKLVASDDFRSALLAPQWNPASGQWQVADGVLVGTGPAALLALREKVPVPMRLEYDARSAAPEDLSAFYLDNPPDYGTGYLFGFGSGGNTENKILYNGEYLAQGTQPLPVAGKWHHVIAQILPGDRLQLIVDDKLALEAHASHPIGPARYPGLWTWGRAEFRNVRLYTGWLASP